MSKNKRVLGRGLSALLENDDTDITNNQIKRETKTEAAGSVAMISIGQIEANPFQPRTKFEEEALNDLSNSIATLGIIQPVTVRKLGYNKYQLISGERRFRASQLAGLEEIPAYIRIANDQAMLEMALVENIQRADLDAIEVAISYQRLIDECKLTQEELSHRVGKKRSTVANYLRLLKLPAEIQNAIVDKTLTMGHARALINLKDTATQLKMFNEILQNELSVRQTEELVKERKPSKTVKKAAPVPLSFHEQKMKADLSEFFQTTVKLQRNDEETGKIVIPFESQDHLLRIMELLDL